MTLSINTLGIVLIILSLYFFISPFILRLKKMDKDYIKKIWPKDSYPYPQILYEAADHEKFTNYINTFFGDINKISKIMNFISGTVTLISGIVILISVNL